jgi:hypothetical protein
MVDSKTAAPEPHGGRSPEPTAGTMQTTEIAMPRWKRVWRHSLTQMMLLSVQAFCGPAMSDAIAGE